MAEARHDLGRALKLTPDATGEPGHRTFRLLVEAERGSACLWVEKEQLFQLAISIRGLLEEHEADLPPPARPTPDLPDGEPGLEFQVRKLALGQDATGRLWSLAAFDEADAEFDTPTVSLLASHEEFDAFSNEALEVCAAGRPLCPLCGGPMDPGEAHRCPRANGKVTL